MTDQVQQNLKVTDQGIESSVQKTPEAAKQDGVIAEKPNQETFGQANTIKHQNDQTLSEPDMIAMEEGETVAEYKAKVARIQANRCGYYDSAEKGNGSAEETGAVIDYEQEKIGDNFYASGMDYEEGRDTRSIDEKLADFGKAAAARASDPEGQKAYIQGQLDKIIGIGEGLNIAKDSTKAAVVAGWTALTDGTVANFLAKPNAMNDPLFHAVGGALDAMAKDPNAVNHALERVGTIVMSASENYTAAPNREKGHVIGETMFALVNPEGSTEGGELALKIADGVATHVDDAVAKLVMNGYKSAEDQIMAFPKQAESIRKLLYNRLEQLNLTPQQLEYAGIPRGYFDGMQAPPGAGKGDNLLAMSKADDAAEGLPRHSEGGIERREPVPEKLPPSERFIGELKQVVESLSEGERNFLHKHGIEIKPVRRIADKFPNSEYRAACFDPTEKTIYVAEEVLSLRKWAANKDVAFAMKHEMGHAVNAKAHPFGEWISDTKDFIRNFNEDYSKVSLAFRDDLRLPKDARLARDEVFSDLWAHSTGAQSNNPYSQLLKQHFPNVFRFFTEHLNP